MIKGGEFLIKDQEAKDIFIPEEFTEDQLMMASATKEFVEKELDPHRERFEKKDYKLTWRTINHLITWFNGRG